MSYKIPFQAPDDLIDEIVVREAKKQKLKFKPLPLPHLKALADVGKDIQRGGLPKHLLRKKLPHNLGDGIFLHPDAEPLLKGSLVAVYTGKRCIVPQNLLEDALYAFEPLSDMHLTKQEQHLFDPKARFHPRRLYCIHVDAQKVGNFTRFINHSEKPNIIAELMSIPKNSKGIPQSPLVVIYFVCRKILPGEQLLISYDGDDHSYWSALGIKPYPLFADTFIVSSDKKGTKLSQKQKTIS